MNLLASIAVSTAASATARILALGLPLARYCAAGGLILALSVKAQELPPGTVTLLVPYPAGGVSDVLARAAAPVLSRTIQRKVIVENLGGASGSIAAARFLSRAPDGAQLLVGSPTETILAPLTIRSLHYRAEDFSLLGLLYSAPLAVYARPDLPADSVDDLAAWTPLGGRTSANYGSPGPGSIYHILTENLRNAVGMQATHIPYKGGAPLLQDLMAGTIDFAMLPVDNVMSQLVGAGKLKVLGVAAARRTARFPDAATLDEGKRSRQFGHPAVWVGLFVSQATPEALRARLQQALSEALAQPDTRRALEAAGGTVPAALGHDEAAIFYARQTVMLQNLARAAKVQAD
jgi:tripartite-type tricarboxylate transporter receptor subunit TctC